MTGARRSIGRLAVAGALAAACAPSGGERRDSAAASPGTAAAGTTAARAPLLAKVEHFYASAADAERMFEFFRDTLGLPQVWRFQGWGDFASGGVSLGNVAFELVRWKPDSGGVLRTEFAGVAFEPVGDTDATIAELARRGVPYDKPDTNRRVSAQGRPAGWVNTGLPDVGQWFFVCDYQDRDAVATSRRTASDSLAARRGGPLGVRALREIVLGVADVEGARTHWRKLIDSPAQETADGVYAFGAGPRLRLVRADTSRLRGIVVEVESLERARGFLAGRGLLGDAAGDRVSIAPSAIGGLSISLVER